jgi:hypothetical protein
MITKDQYDCDIAILQKALEDKRTELMDEHRDHRRELNHYMTGAKITRRRTTELESRIVELEVLVSTMHVGVIESAMPVVVIEPVPVAVIVEPVPVVNDILPRGYYFEGATTLVNNLSFPVVRGPNLGYHTLRSAFVLKRMSALQLSRMVRGE